MLPTPIDRSSIGYNERVPGYQVYIGRATSTLSHRDSICKVWATRNVVYRSPEGHSGSKDEGSVYATYADAKAVLLAGFDKWAEMRRLRLVDLKEEASDANS